MNYQDFASYVRYHTKTDSTTLTDAELVLLANVEKDNIAKEIAKVNEDIFGMWFTRNIEEDVREYSFPSNVLSNIKYLEVKIANGGTEWKHFDEFDLNKYKRTTDEASIIANFAGKYLFDIFRKSLWLYCEETMIAVEEGIKLWAIQYPADVATGSLSSTTDMSVDPTTTSSGMPRESHELWARATIISYKNSQEKPIPLTEKELNYKADLKLMLDSLRGTNLDRQNTGDVPYNDGSQY